MSRSYKHHPICKIQYAFAKVCARHKARRIEDLPNGSGYKKVYPQYDICDQCYFGGSVHKLSGGNPTKEDLQRYRKFYKQK